MIAMRSILTTCVLLLLTAALTLSQAMDPRLFGGLKWRMIGPHRGGRTVGAVGVPQKPNVFYIGVNNGGVWRTSDYGRTWVPIFDGQPTGSIGDVAVAGSNPRTIYVATGEGLQRPDLSVGNGMYKSTDEGATWSHIGLENGLQIGGIAVDPKNEQRVFAAVLGHPYGPNTERGVFRTTDGGATWERVLYKDENTGAVQVTFDPKDPKIVYAVLWANRLGPWENGTFAGPGSGLFKSTDGGTTWTQLLAGLPGAAQGLGRIGLAIAPSDTTRLYATVEATEGSGIYRSDDAGAHWRMMNPDERFWGRGSDFAELKVDPANRDRVYSANVVTWRSEDGAATWGAFRGAPGGDDYHRIWINPTNPDIILLASDQGAIITVNGGETFSSWYNQPTAQFYHVSTDNAFPYNVYGGQQESGSVGISSRGNDGQITFREWHPVGVEEYGYVAPDPLDPNIIYGGKITRFDKRTGQIQNIAPEAVRSGKYRFLRTAPVLFSPVDQKTLFFAGNVLFKTRDGGQSWEVISPDLSRATWDIPAPVGVYATEAMKTMPRRGVIYTVAPSPRDVKVIWAGTDDGLIHRTSDGGKHWTDVTPPGVTSWSKVSLIDAGHADAKTAYAAVNRIRLDDLRPHIYKTHDAGATWQEITAGLPDEPINAVREDPARPGLLYAGSENAVYVSFDDGAHWQSLRLNMPATSIRDLVVKDNDLVVGTHGRSFWILDNISRLRSMRAADISSPLLLYPPASAMRVRWNMNSDTPIPQEEPAGENPPDGAMIEYVLAADASSGPVTLEIKDGSGRVVRRYSSDDPEIVLPPLNIPLYWVRPQQHLSAKAGAHRFLWDMHYTPFDVPPSYPIAAIYKNTAPDPNSPWVLPGRFTLTLSAGGASVTQPLVVTMDPRVKAPKAALALQHELSMTCYDGRRDAMASAKELRALRAQAKDRSAKASGETAAALKAADDRMAALEGGSLQAPGFGFVSGAFAGVLNILHDVDASPTSQAVAAVAGTEKQLKELRSAFDAWKRKELPVLNAALSGAGLAPIAP
jgi:photosystem II stability/assembly factor-like uncharacterized protein